MSATTDEDAPKVIELVRPSRRLYEAHGDTPLLEILMKAEDPQAASPSAVNTSPGHKSHPFDFDQVSKFQLANVHHSTCLKTKVASTVGLSFKKESTEEQLDLLCKGGWQGTANKFCEEYYQAGNGYLECVYGDATNPNRITGLHQHPARSIHVVVDDPVKHFLHYEIVARDSGQVVRFAEFGDRLAYDKRYRDGQLQNVGGGSGTLQPTSELIHWKRESSLSQWYGFPDWLAAVAACELVQALHQHNYDFFINRGVPEFLLFILGNQMAPDDWKKVESTLKAQVGLGNSHKSAAFNLKDPTMKVQLEKLGLEGKSDATTFGALAETLSLEIVSAHRVPPLLAGIVIPGRLGSNNELPNALMAFQILVIGPAQRALASLLNTTLGRPEINGGLKLARGDFEFNKITEEMNLNMMQTVGGMRQTLPEAQAQGRDLTAGMKKSIDEGGYDELKGLMIGHVLSLALERINEKRLGAAA